MATRMDTVLIFAGGKPLPATLIDELPSPGLVMAADSGYEVAEALGFSVDVLVGDMDSIESLDSVPSSVEVVRHPEAKDATDLELALELAIREDPHRIVLVGAEGGRYDHEIGAAATIASPRWAGVPEIDWIRSDAIVHVVRGTRRIQGDPGDLLSLLPVGGDASGVTTTGLAWPLRGETLHAGSSRGVSNRLLGTEAVVQVESGAVLAVIPAQAD